MKEAHWKNKGLTTVTQENISYMYFLETFLSHSGNYLNQYPSGLNELSSPFITEMHVQHGIQLLSTILCSLM